MLKPGIYKLELIIAGDNASPIKVELTIIHAGNWFDTENDMFNEENVRLKLNKIDKTISDLIRTKITEPLIKAKLIVKQRNQ